MNLVPKYISRTLVNEGGSRSIDLRDTSLRPSLEKKLPPVPPVGDRRGSISPANVETQKETVTITRFSPSMIIDTMIVPHVLNVCVSEQLSFDYQILVYENVVAM
ncbi:hypothetical protein HK096_009908, partial [Nowakowskiella sp. JEL0078]